MEYRIKECRKQLGMTQEELSIKSGVSREIISGLERGTTRTTTVQTLVKIADALGVPVKDIFFEPVV